MSDTTTGGDTTASTAATGASTGSAGAGLLDGVQAASTASQGSTATNASTATQTGANGQGNATGDASTASTATATAFSLYKDGGLDPAVSKLFEGEQFKGARSVFEKYAKADDPMKAFVQGVENLNYMASKKGLAPLPPDAPAAVKAERDAAIKTALGVPAKPEDYGIKKPDNLPAGVEWDDAVVGEYLKVMHEGNVAPETARKLVELNTKLAASQGEAFTKKSLETARTELTTAYGDKLPAALADAERGIDIASGLTGIPAEQLTAASRNNPTMIRVMAALKAATSEDSFVSGKGTPTGKNYMEQADAIMTDPTNPLYADFKSGDDSRVSKASHERQRLIKLHLATGGKA